MPPRSSPHKLRFPILRKHTWYMTWTEGDSAALHPIAVQFYAETYDGKHWKHCNHLHKPCESVRRQRSPIRNLGDRDATYARSAR
ncbi:hypothetical protein N7501_004225 [Penicillium viridicatum]|nr:hypothetical protein N7501_004225 [Penicillium viridicatum]